MRDRQCAFASESWILLEQTSGEICIELNEERCVLLAGGFREQYVKVEDRLVRASSRNLGCSSSVLRIRGGRFCSSLHDMPSGERQNMRMG